MNVGDDFIHIDVCISRLGNCHQTLRDVRANRDHVLAGPAFQYALVEYCTAFTTSQAVDKRRRRLDDTMVPAELQALHNRILETRNQLLAHADMAILDGSISFRHFDGQLMTTTTLNHVDPLAELDNIDEILFLVESVQGKLFARRKARLDEVSLVEPVSSPAEAEPRGGASND